MFSLRRTGELSVFHTDLFPLSVSHGFTTRRLASGKPSPTGETVNFRIDSLPETTPWWTQLRNSLFTPDHVCLANKQVHGGKVRVVDPDNLEGEERIFDSFKIRILGDGDAIIKPFTRKPLFCAITTADCLPCLVHDRVTGSVAVVHAGWKSLAADIPGAAVREFKKSLGSKPGDLSWAVGPAIDLDNYEVGPEVIAALETAGYAESDWENTDRIPGWVRDRKGDRYHLNLGACIKIRLMDLGIPEDRIDICSMSTFSNPNLFYSYRRDGGILGLQASVIG